MYNLFIILVFTLSFSRAAKINTKQSYGEGVNSHVVPSQEGTVRYYYSPAVTMNITTVGTAQHISPATPQYVISHAKPSYVSSSSTMPPGTGLVAGQATNPPVRVVPPGMLGRSGMFHTLPPMPQLKMAPVYVSQQNTVPLVRLRMEKASPAIVAQPPGLSTLNRQRVGKSRGAVGNRGKTRSPGYASSFSTYDKRRTIGRGIAAFPTFTAKTNAPSFSIASLVRRPPIPVVNKDSDLTDLIREARNINTFPYTHELVLPTGDKQKFTVDGNSSFQTTKIDIKCSSPDVEDPHQKSPLVSLKDFVESSFTESPDDTDQSNESTPKVRKVMAEKEIIYKPAGTKDMSETGSIQSKTQFQSDSEDGELQIDEESKDEDSKDEESQIDAESVDDVESYDSGQEGSAETSSVDCRSENVVDESLIDENNNHSKKVVVEEIGNLRDPCMPLSTCSGTSDADQTSTNQEDNTEMSSQESYDDDTFQSPSYLGRLTDDPSPPNYLDPWGLGKTKQKKKWKYFSGKPRKRKRKE